jgi:hypothetical protein
MHGLAVLLSEQIHHLSDEFSCNATTYDTGVNSSTQEVNVNSTETRHKNARQRNLTLVNLQSQMGAE